MAELFTLENLFTLLVLIVLQAVLGFDNLLYISIESKRVEQSKQSFVRKLGIGLAIFLRIVLLVVLVYAIGKLQKPFFEYGLELQEATATEPAEHGQQSEQANAHEHYVLTSQGKYFAAVINVHSVIVLVGGIFIIYTAFKEIFHMLSIDHIEHHVGQKTKQRSAGAAIFWIVLMNLVFSFDSILSAIALATEQGGAIQADDIWIMTAAIVVSGVLMILLADHVAEFLKKNRMYEVLGLFILLIVGVMLVSEGGHLAHLHFFGHEIAAMSKVTFYFVIAVMVAVDIVQTRYQKKLMRQREAELKHKLGEAPA